MQNDLFELNNFSQLFEQCRKPYTLFAYSYVKDMKEAEDIYMEVMMRFWEKREDLPTDLHLPSYLLTAVKNRALNYLRQLNVKADADLFFTEHQSRELGFRISTLEACNPSELFTDEIRRITYQTLDELTEYSRIIFFMSRLDNKTNKEIASELDVNIKTVEYHITKTLKLLRTNLRDYLPFF